MLLSAQNSEMFVFVTCWRINETCELTAADDVLVQQLQQIISEHWRLTN